MSFDCASQELRLGEADHTCGSFEDDVEALAETRAVDDPYEVVEGATIITSKLGGGSWLGIARISMGILRTGKDCPKQDMQMIGLFVTVESGPSLWVCKLGASEPLNSMQKPWVSEGWTARNAGKQALLEWQR